MHVHLSYKHHINVIEAKESQMTTVNMRNLFLNIM